MCCRILADDMTQNSFLPTAQLTSKYGIRWAGNGTARLALNDLRLTGSILSLKFALCVLQRWVSEVKVPEDGPFFHLACSSLKVGDSARRVFGFRTILSSDLLCRKSWVRYRVPFMRIDQSNCRASRCRRRLSNYYLQLQWLL
jgi:hypothetical protein